MSNASPSPIVQNSITTLPASAPAAPEPASPPQAAPEKAAAPAPPVVEPSGAASEGEKAPDPAPDKHLELAKRFESAAKRESNVRRLESKAQETLQKLEAQQKALEEQQKELEEALSDPVAYYLKKGKDPVEIARRFSKPETEEQKEIRLLKEKLDAREAREKQERETQAQQAHEHARWEAMREFVNEITPANAPNLTTVYEAREVPRLVEDLLSRPVEGGTTLLKAFIVEHGRPPTNEEIREALEQEAGPRATRILEANAARAKASQPETPGHEQASAGPNGISNQHAAVTSAGKPRKLSLEERRKAARNEIVAGLVVGPDATEE